ncbi:G-protein coupled receptor 54 [Holothuria leucospilota]|uniref:G-protein coupled receptor 54 n=1 Tax=Holothuria leucospilota TaxID=206669 RepID=A0A9Q1HA08_HOLLE|nr:G-protein coupled receptor 54 [Holothuria leucospilota]
MAENTSFYTVASPSPSEWDVPEYRMTFLSLIIFLESAAGIVGNVAVLLIVVCFRDMHTLINLSFANLAVSDLCVFFLDAIPTALDVIGCNISSKLGCRIPYYMQWVTGQVTCLTLAFLSYDRYRVVVRPFNSLRHRSSRQVWMLLLAMWSVSFIIQAPMIYVGSPNERGLCQEYAPKHGVRFFFSAETVSLFLVPLAIMCFCHYHIWRTLVNSRRVPSQRGCFSSSVDSSVLTLNRKLWRQRKRGIRVVTAAVLTFALCCAPIHSVHLWYAYSGNRIQEHDIFYVQIHTVANAIMYFSNFMNPYIYAFLGKGFRRHTKDIVRCFSLRQQLMGYSIGKKDASTWL